MSRSDPILDAAEIRRTIRRMAHQILEHHPQTGDLALVGIHTRGVYLARRLQQAMEEAEASLVACGEIDITLYRDDWTQISHQPVVKKTEIPFSVENKKIVLVDDVLFTGRTVRAAMDALMDFGRPARIELAVLIDRGHRELPIQGNYTGKQVPTRRSETVNVMLQEVDGVDQVVVTRPAE